MREHSTNVVIDLLNEAHICRNDGVAHLFAREILTVILRHESFVHRVRIVPFALIPHRWHDMALVVAGMVGIRR